MEQRRDVREVFNLINDCGETESDIIILRSMKRRTGILFLQFALEWTPAKSGDMYPVSVYS